MNIFCGPIAAELRGFLQFKRDLGYGYRRAEFTLREFDRFLIKYLAKNRHWQLDQAAISWLSSKPGRKAVSCVWQVPLAQFGGLIWPTLSY